MTSDAAERLAAPWACLRERVRDQICGCDCEGEGVSGEEKEIRGRGGGREGEGGRGKRKWNGKGVWCSFVH